MELNEFGHPVVSPSAGRNEFGHPILGGTPIEPSRANSYLDLVVSGLQNSATVLAVRGKLPEQQLGENATWDQRLVYNAATMLGDIPVAIPGAAFGAGFGAGVSGPAAPAGAVIGGMAGAFAVPMALREALTAAYKHNNALSWGGVWDIALAGLKGGGKGAVIGGTTGYAGRLAAPLVARTGASGEILNPFATGVATTSAELVALTATSAALEGHMPTWQDFMDNAILLGGMKGAVHVAGKMMDVYAETGRTPAEVLGDATRDPALKGELTGEIKMAPEGVALDALKPGESVRLYRGENAANEAGGQWWTSSRVKAEKYGDVTEVVLPAEVIGRNAARGHNGADEFVFPNARPPELAASGIPSALPPVPEGHVRLYRGQPEGKFPPAVDYVEGRGVAEAGRWFTTDNTNTSFYGPKQMYVDVPKSVAAEAFGGSKTHPETGHLLPAEWANKAQSVGGGIPSAYALLALEERIKAAINHDPTVELIRRSLSPDTTNPPKLSDHPLEPVKWEYITSVDALKGLIRDVSAMTDAQIKAQTRGVVTNNMTRAEALKDIATGEVHQHQVGAAGNAAQMLVAAMLLKSAANHVVAERAKLAGIPEARLSPADKLGVLAALEKMAMVNAEFAGLRAESGRTQQILSRIARDPSFLGEANAIIGFAERKGTFQDLLRMLDRLKDPTKMARFADGYQKATTSAKVIEAWRAAIFSGPLTWQANMMGNTAKWGMDVVEAPIAAGIEAGMRAGTTDPLTAVQVRARALAPWYGLQLAALDGIHLMGEWGRVVKESGLAEGVKAVKSDVLDFLRQGDEKMDVTRRANEGVVGAGVGFFFGALKLQDLLFRTVGERGRAYILAVDRAVADGIHPSAREFKEAVARYVDNPTLGLTEKAAQKALDAIEKAGNEAVFAEQLGPRTAQVSGAMSGTAWEFLFPARRTPINLLDWAVQHTPGLNFMSGRWRADYAAGGERKAQAITRVVVGTGLAATAYGLAQSGILTGGGLFDRELSGTKAGAGVQNYSLLLDGKYYSIQRIEPVAKLMMLTGDLYEIINSSKVEQDKAKAVGMLVLAFANATISTTYMSGLSNMMKAATDPDRYLETFYESYAASLVPKFIGQPAALIDPHKREVDGVMDAIQSQLPFLRERLLPKRDVWGKPAQNDRWFSVAPVTTTEKSLEKVKTEAVRLQVAIADAPKFLEEKGPFKSGEKRFEITGEERDLMRQVTGEFASSMLSRYVNDPDWESIPRYAQAIIYQKVLEVARKVGTSKAVPADSPERVRLRQVINERIEKESQEAVTKATERRVK